MSMHGEIMLWATNPEWYDYDENEEPYLTEKAPESAQKAFKEYLEIKKREKETGVRIM